MDEDEDGSGILEPEQEGWYAEECYNNTAVILTPESRQTDRVKEIETFLV